MYTQHLLIWFLTEMHGVYCADRPGSSDETKYVSSLKG